MVFAVTHGEECNGVEAATKPRAQGECGQP